MSIRREGGGSKVIDGPRFADSAVVLWICKILLLPQCQIFARGDLGPK